MHGTVCSLSMIDAGHLLCYLCINYQSCYPNPNPNLVFLVHTYRLLGTSLAAGCQLLRVASGHVVYHS